MNQPSHAHVLIENISGDVHVVASVMPATPSSVRSVGDHLRGGRFATSSFIAFDLGRPVDGIGSAIDALIADEALTKSIVTRPIGATATIVVMGATTIADQALQSRHLRYLATHDIQLRFDLLPYDEMEDVLVEKGSGNVYADLGIENAEGAMLKSEMIVDIRDFAYGKGIDGARLARLAGMSEDDLSLLMKGRFGDVGLDRLTAIRDAVMRCGGKPVTSAGTP